MGIQTGFVKAVVSRMACFQECLLRVLPLYNHVKICFSLGGAYYLISRSLGPEFGGSIGVIFSVASAVATAMYVVGFAETVRDILRDNDSLMVDESNDIRIVGLITILVLLGITMIGLQWVVRAQMILLIVLVISILNVMIGTFIGPQSEESRMKGFVGYKKDLFETNFNPGYKDESFFSVFAVFFPAATGILAGVNISGDLKSVRKAVPKGTLLAIIISTLVYIMLAWFVGSCVEREALGFAPEVLQNSSNHSLASCAEQQCQYGLLHDYQVKWTFCVSFFCLFVCNAFFCVFAEDVTFTCMTRSK